MFTKGIHFKASPKVISFTNVSITIDYFIVTIRMVAIKILTVIVMRAITSITMMN